MYKLAIIDDEPLIQLGVHSLIKYKELSLIPCPFVNTGLEALQLLREQRPDIVLLDIAIPDLNGLELISTLREEAPDYRPVLIILTNHNDFSYVQAALRLGVMDFITKIEINEEYLTCTLKKAISHLEKQHPVLSEAQPARICDNRALLDLFFNKLLNDGFADCDEQTMCKECARMDIFASSYGVCCFTMQRLYDNEVTSTLHAVNLINECMKSFFPCYTTLWNAECILCITRLSGEEKQDEAKLREALHYTLQMLSRYMNRCAYVGVGPFCTQITQVSNAFQISSAVCQMASQEQPVRFAREVPSERLKGENEEFHMCEFREKLISAFDAYDTQQVRSIFETIRTNYIEKNTRIHEILSICFSILHFISSAFHYSQALDSELFGNKVDPVETLRNIRQKQQAEEWLRQLEENICQKLTNEWERSQNWLVPSIRQYIETHPDESLSLNEVASVFEMSPGYISTLFKRYGAQSFSECVRVAKLNRAKELLRQQMKIQEVSDALCYSDPYYFSRIFKKYEGISPKEYALKYRKTSE